MLKSMDMVEVNPSLSSEEESQKTVQMAVGLIACARGNQSI
jgi:arginase family enzyme